ncbi:MAG: M20 family metallopeptidase, partial [Candidatus Odinarchaeota archaeon]|nr:M20 family metallopeptidase [Candidatus Odinarchaeota archaeon]
IIDLTKRLIKTKPENPPGLEEPTAMVIKEELEKMGAEVKVEYVQDKRPNVIGIFKGKKPGKIVLFNGHSDVVPAGPNWSMPPFEGIVKDNKLYGRGAVDMFGGLAAMLEAVRVFINEHPDFPGEIIYTVVVGEETGGIGAKKIVQENLKADYVIVGEPSNNVIYVGERGILWSKIKCEGKSAHASLPHKGVNAIEVLIRALLALKEMKLEYEPHKYFGIHTFNIGKIEGGIKANIVAPSAEATIDMRLPPGTKISTVKEKLKELLDAYEKMYDVKFDVEYIIESDAYETPENSDLVLKFKLAAEEVLGKGVKLGGMMGATDGRFFYEKGMKTIIFGPGPLSCAHTADEYVEIPSLLNAAKVYYRALEKLLLED